jgi:hypothetical protein
LPITLEARPEETRHEPRPRIRFDKVLNRRWSNVLLPFLALLDLFTIFFFHTDLLLDLAFMVWLSVIPGVVLLFVLSQILRIRVSWLLLLSLGAAIGLGVAPIIFSILEVIDNPAHTAVLVSALNVMLLGAVLLLPLRVQKLVFPQSFGHAWRVLWGCLLFVTLFLQVYNFQNIYFDHSGNLITRGLFGVDLPYLVGQMASLKSWPDLRDLHQLATPMFYHDFAYKFIVAINLLTKHELFDILLTVHPIFAYALFAISVYALSYELTHKSRVSALVIGAMFLLGSFTGTEQGSSALSPSFVWGNILFLNSLLLLALLLRKSTKEEQENSLPKPAIIVLLTVILLILSRSKITTFAALESGMSLLILIQLIRHKWSDAFGLLIPVALSAILLLLGSREQSPFLPGGDFLIGAPLLGYANHIGSILHIPVAEINPVSAGFHFAFRQLLIIPYFLFHLGRFVVTDGRLLVLLIAIVLLRKRIVAIALPNTDPILFWVLAAFVPIGFMLPVLYSPAWYPLAFSFYTPLVGVECATILCVLILFGIAEQHELRGRTVFLAVFGVLVLGSLIGNIRSIAKEDASQAKKTDVAQIEALRYLRDHSATHSVIASFRYDLADTGHDEWYYTYSAFSERPVISEGSAYGVLLAALATVDSAKGLHPVKLATDTLLARRVAIDSIYLSKNSVYVAAALHKYNAKYILEDKEIKQHLAIDPKAIAEPFFENSAMMIWKVRR